MKRLLFMVIVTIVVLGSFARPEKENNTSVSPAHTNNIKNTASHNSKAGNSTVQYKKG
jgi:hypothetical protein